MAFRLAPSYSELPVFMVLRFLFPQIVEGDADVLAIFLAGKLDCESTEYFSAFATTMTSQHLSIQGIGPSAAV